MDRRKWELLGSIRQGLDSYGYTLDVSKPCLPRALFVQQLYFMCDWHFSALPLRIVLLSLTAIERASSHT